MQNTPAQGSTREYFYTLDQRGTLRHDGSEIVDERVLHRFFRDLRVNSDERHTDYPYLSVCGRERNYVKVEDSPIVFHTLHEGRLSYAPDLYVDFDPRSLRFGSNGVLYHAAPLAELGRMSASLTMQLSTDIKPWGPWYRYYDKANNLHEVIEAREHDDQLRLLRPRDGNACVGCGRDSETGLKLSFLYNSQDDSVRSWFTPDNRLMGSLNIMHGGFVALLLDESMGKILGAKGIKAPTAQLNVRYRAPVPIGQELELRASVQQTEGRKNHLCASIHLAADPARVLAEAQALFIRINRDNASVDINVNARQ